MRPVSGNHSSKSSGLGPIPGQRSKVGTKSEHDPVKTSTGVLDMTWNTEVAGALVIALSGVLDAPGTLSLRELLEEQIGLTRFCRVVLDLTAIIGLSRDGVELLLQLHRRSHIDGFVVVLVGSSLAEVERPLLAAGALPLFATRLSVRHALAGVSSAIATTS